MPLRLHTTRKGLVPILCQESVRMYAKTRVLTVQLKCAKLGRSAFVFVDICWECDLSRPTRYISLSTKIVGDRYNFFN